MATKKVIKQVHRELGVSYDKEAIAQNAELIKNTINATLQVLIYNINQ